MTKSLSIKQIFAQANKAMLLFAVIPLLLSILLYSQQLLIYQQTIANIQKADAIALKVDQRVLESMWDLISGQVSVDEFKKENILEELRNDIRQIKSNTNTLKEISTLDETVYRKCITPPRLGDFSEIRGMNHGQSCPFRRFSE